MADELIQNEDIKQKSVILLKEIQHVLKQETNRLADISDCVDELLKGCEKLHESIREVRIDVLGANEAANDG